MTEQELKLYFADYKDKAAQIEIWQKYTEYKEDDSVPDDIFKIIKRHEVMDICLNSLDERERFLILYHVINHNTWEVTSKQAAEEWGNWNSRSERTMKRIQKAALRKMLDIIKNAGADDLFE